MNSLYCLCVGVFLCFAFVDAAHFSRTEKHTLLSDLTATWVEPHSPEFKQYRIESPMMNYTKLSERNVRDQSECPCTSIFQENSYSAGEVPAELIEALSFAQCLWSCILELPANSVQVDVVKTAGAPGVLASAGPLMDAVDDTVTPCALAGCDGPDIQMNVDPNSIDYYYGIDANPGPNQYDFVTIALHELGHGFGMIGYITNSGSGYRIPGPAGAVFDTLIRKGESSFPWQTNPPVNSMEAIAAITSEDLFFEGKKYQSTKLYAPSGYSQGSSVYHLDEYAYPAGDADSLMTPMLGNGEAVHSVGRLMCDCLASIGYEITSWKACEAPESS
jgi:hypothetical protein